MPLEPKEVHEYLKEIQPFPYHVYNCDDIGFNLNGLWHRVVYTYKFFTGRRIRKYQKVDTPPLWFIAMIFTISDVQCFMPPVIFHQA